MLVIRDSNVDSIYPRALELLREVGVRRESRNGPVLMAPCPVTSVYHRPWERVIRHPWRDANPTFHLMECLWMISGRRDVASLTRYVKRMAEFSDDGLTLNAAYGRRWRHARLDVINTDDGPYDKTRDQLEIIIDGLRKNPNCRQQVLQIWDHALDLGTTSKDHACNLTATLQISVEGKLDIVVLCRSNDVIWGCYGANAVHFSFLLEYLAARIGVPIGTYSQVSVNWHAYEDLFLTQLDKKREAIGAERWTEYASTDTTWEFVPILKQSEDHERFDSDCRAFFDTEGRRAPSRFRLDSNFCRHVVWPIVSAHDHYVDQIKTRRSKDWSVIYDLIDECFAPDWRVACTEWYERRERVYD